jgi:hypothetical protein
VRATEIVVGDPPAAWAALGFAMTGGACEVGGVRIVAAGTLVVELVQSGGAPSLWGLVVSVALALMTPR